MLEGRFTQLLKFQMTDLVAPVTQGKTWVAAWWQVAREVSEDRGTGELLERRHCSALLRGLLEETAFN